MAESLVPDLPDRPAAPAFAWDPKAYGGRGGYRRAGRFVSWATVRSELDVVLDGMSVQMKAVTSRMVAGELTVAEWQAAMMPMVKQTHMVAGAAASGGWGQMTFADYGRVGQVIRKEYGYLGGFAEELVSGQQPMGGGAVFRAGMYGQAGRPTFHAFEQAKGIAAGHDEERSTLNPAEHCGECIDEADRGWVPIGTLKPIGRRQCLSNCRCGYETRKRPEGE